jgi:hypothetical protein
MFATRLFAVAALAMPVWAQGGVVINEFQYDDSGTDDREFVELYNSSNAAVDISGWTLEHWDQKQEGLTNTNANANKSITIPANTVLAAGAYYVFGDSTKVNNVNQAMAAGFLENSQEAIVLRDANDKMVDSVVYEGFYLDPNLTWYKMFMNGNNIYSTFASIDGRETSLSRLVDGLNNGDARDWGIRPITPGATNDITSPPVFIDNFDRGVPDTVHMGFHASWVRPNYIDPTVIGQANQNAIPASPQGGNAIVVWDPTGGGDAAWLTQRPADNVVVEGYTYFDTTSPQASNYRECWSIGLGSTGTYYNRPDPEKLYGDTSNGNRGVSMTYVNDGTNGAAIYLIDHNDGGLDFKVLGKIDIKQGVNDGWQHFRFEVTGTTAGVWIGGQMNQGGGDSIGGTVEPIFGDVYFGYRELNDPNTACRPLTIDDLRVRPSQSKVELYGSASSTTVGAVEIGCATPPVLGTTGFGVTGNNLAASSPAILLMGFQRLSLPLAGAAQGSMLYTLPIIVATGASDANGMAMFPFPLPQDTSLNGAKLDWQLLGVDAGLSVGLPLAASAGAETTLSN